MLYWLTPLAASRGRENGRKEVSKFNSLINHICLFLFYISFIKIAIIKIKKVKSNLKNEWKKKYKVWEKIKTGKKEKIKL